jgi:hypothetical protein
LLTAQSARSLLLSCLPRCCLIVLVLAPVAAFAQATPAANDAYARKNSFGIFTAYSNDSSHILLGIAEQRKLLQIGASYSRRLILNHIVNWQYDGEILPVALESDPLTKFVNKELSPSPGTYTGSGLPPMIICNPAPYQYDYILSGVTYEGTQTEYCSGRQWTIGEGISPVGMQWNFRPMHTIQPLVEGHGGYMYTTHPIPTANAGSFNFTFDFGAGFEWYRSHSRSWRAEYRYHHISNHGTALENPGIDNGLFQLSYVFGR